MNGPPVRIGCVRYLNTLPLVQGLSAWRDAEVVSAVPSRLINLLLEGRIDLGLVSVVDFARSGEPLVMIPAGMIGCDGPTLTVRLYSAVPMERVRRLHADTDSHTSVALARIILARAHGRREVEVVGFDASERASAAGGGGRRESDPWPETLLLIGDKVVTDAPPEGRYPCALDLGQAWKDLTGLPFVYAAWMCRRAALEDEATAARVRAAAAVLDRARRRNRMRADWVVATGAPARGWPEDLARRYVGEYLRYDVGDREREAVARFLAEAAALGLAPASAPAWAEV
jgi:chorismate dehydratase